MVNIKTENLNSELCSLCNEYHCNFITRCNHYYHKYCITKKLEERKRCPRCLESLTSNTLYEKVLAGYEVTKGEIFQENLEDSFNFLHLLADSKVKIPEKTFEIAFYRAKALGQRMKAAGSDGTSLLYKGAKNGHLFIVKLVWENTSHCLDSDGDKYPLFAACEGGNTDIINFLLDKGAEIDKINPSNDFSFAHYAAMSGSLDIINRAIGMNVDFLVKNNKNITTLHAACEKGRLDAAKKLIELGVDQKSISDDRISILHASCIGGNFELFKMCVDAGLDIHATYKDGVSAIHAAVCGGNVDILKYLIEHNVDASKCKFSPLHLAACSNNLMMLKKLLGYDFDINAVNEEGNTALHHACALDHDKMAKFLLEAGAKINIKNSKGELPDVFVYKTKTAAELCIRDHFDDDFISVLSDEHKHYLKVLADHHENKALVLTEFSPENYDLLKPLFDPEADWNTTVLDEEGNTILLLLSKLKLWVGVCTALEAGLNPNVSNYNGDTPLHFSCAFNDVETVIELLEYNANWNVINMKGQNPLHMAILGDSPPKVVHAVSEGNLNAVDNEGNTPVHLAFAVGYYYCFDCEEILSEIDFNLKNKEGKTPMHLAAENGHVEAVKFLIEKGVNANVADLNNNLPIDLARINNHKEIVDLLRI